MEQLATEQHRRPSKADLGLPLTIMVAGFASGTDFNPTIHTYSRLRVLGGVGGFRMLDGLKRSHFDYENSGTSNKTQYVDGADISTHKQTPQFP